MDSEDSNVSSASFSSQPFLSDSSSVLPTDRDPAASLHPTSISHSPRNSLRSTVISYVCTTVGAGIISLPLALAEAGWLGALVIVLTGLVCTQTANWLVACMFVGEEALTSYEAIGVAALGRPGKVVVAVIQNVTLFGVCCIFLIIAGGNLSALIPGLSMHAWVLLVGIVLVPVSWLKTVKEIKPLAYFGLFASLLVGGVVVLKGLQTASDGPPAGARWSWLSGGGLSTCVNIVVFSLGSHSVIPNQVNEMQDARRTYRQFTLRAYALISTIYCVVALCGYAGYGSLTQDNVLNSIDSPSADHRTHVLVQVARFFIVAHVLLAYPLPLNPVSLFLEDNLGILQLSEKAQLLPRLALRSSLVVGTVFVATVVPYFGSLLSLVSALSIIATAFVLPPVFYYLLYRGERQFGMAEKARMLAVLALGVLSCVVGVYFAITGLVQDIESNPNPFDNFWG